MKFSFEDDILLDPPEVPKIPLPAGWTNYTLITVLHVIALARIIVLQVSMVELRMKSSSIDEQRTPCQESKRDRWSATRLLARHQE